MNNLNRKDLLKAIHKITPFKGYMETRGTSCPQCNEYCTLLNVEGVKYFLNEEDDCVHECALTELI